MNRLDFIISLDGRLDQAESLVMAFILATLVILATVLATRGPAGLQKFVNAIDSTLLVLSGLVIVSLMTLLFVSIFGRATFKLFLELGIPGLAITDASLFSQMMMVAIVFFAVANVQKVGAHIEVTAIANLMPDKINLAFRIFALAIGITIMGAAAWFSGVEAAKDYYNHATMYASLLELPVWPGRGLVPFGLAWWTLRMAMQMFMPSERYGDIDHIQDRLDKVG